MKQAHITSRFDYVKGDRVLGLCGEEFKIKVLWDDLPHEHPICRPCIDIALNAMTEADVLIASARIRNILMSNSMERLTEILEPDLLLLDSIAESDAEHLAEQARKALAKAERKRAKRTCICTWESPEVMKMDPACPIHGDAVGVVGDPTPGSVQRSDEK